MNVGGTKIGLEEGAEMGCGGADIGKVGAGERRGEGWNLLYNGRPPVMENNNLSCISLQLKVYSLKTAKKLH